MSGLSFVCKFIIVKEMLAKILCGEEGWITQAGKVYKEDKVDSYEQRKRKIVRYIFAL